MKKQLNIKKLILLNLPYILMGLFSTNFGEAWRMAVGADASAKMLSFFSTLPMALTSWWPSLHPLDLLVGKVLGDGGFHQPPGKLCSADYQRQSPVFHFLLHRSSPPFHGFCRGGA